MTAYVALRSSSRTNPIRRNHMSFRLGDTSIRFQEILQSNKQKIFDALQGSNIAQITVRFHGYGDSGQIESIEATNSEGVEIPVPSGPVNMSRVQFSPEDENVASEPHTIEEAIENLCYDSLSEYYGGWEDNEGAYGEFVLNLLAGIINLEFNERYIETTTYNHTL
jgi:hypothetical protein